MAVVNIWHFIRTYFCRYCCNNRIVGCVSVCWGACDASRAFASITSSFSLSCCPYLHLFSLSAGVSTANREQWNRATYVLWCFSVILLSEMWSGVLYAVVVHKRISASVQRMTPKPEPIDKMRNLHSADVTQNTYTMPLYTNVHRTHWTLQMHSEQMK